MSEEASQQSPTPLSSVQPQSPSNVSMPDPQNISAAPTQDLRGEFKNGEPSLTQMINTTSRLIDFGIPNDTEKGLDHNSKQDGK